MKGEERMRGRGRVRGPSLGHLPCYQGPSHSPSVARLSGSMTESNMEVLLHGPLAGLSA